MKIKSIPENPTITLAALNEAVKMYEKIESSLPENKAITAFSFDCGRMSVFELFFGLLGVQFETGDQA